jgi:two-component system chemotaxis sensor kinase CheA
MVELFHEESAEQLDALEQALLRLEEEPDDEEAIDQARRQAHNLKGAARILGLDPIETIAHAGEDVLSQAGEIERLPPEATEALFAGLDGMRRLAETVTTEGLDVNDVDVERIHEQLSAAGPDEGRGGGTPAEAAERDRERRQDPLERARSHRIDTIRVDPERLDRLLRHLGELSATVQGLASERQSLEESLALVDEVDDLVRGELPPETEASVARLLRRDADRLAETTEETLDRLDRRVAHLEELAETVEEGIKETRLVPLATTFRLFSRAVRDLAQAEDKRVRLETEGEEVRADKQVLEELKSPLMHVVRNAVGHGIEPPEERRRAGKDPVGCVRIGARRTAESILVEVEDDGRGIDPEGIREEALRRGLVAEEELEAMGPDEVLSILFDAGFTTRETVSEISGRGIGLETVARSVEQLGGSVDLTSTPRQGTRVRLEVPVELSTVHVLLVCVGPHTYGIPVGAVERVTAIAPSEIEGEEPASVDRGGQAVPLADLGEALELGTRVESVDGRSVPCVLSRAGPRLLGVIVDDLVGETEVVAEPLGPVLHDVRSVNGASVLPDGQVCIILDPAELADDVRSAGELEPRSEPDETDPDRQLLLVEDTQVTRHQLCRTLEGAGWSVLTAADGEQALDVLEEHTVDVVVTDALVPRLDGLGLVRRIRGDPRHRDVPVVVTSTARAAEDAEDAHRAGADAFVTKDPLNPGRLVDEIDALV